MKTRMKNQRYGAAIFLTILTVFWLQNVAYGLNVADRTPQVRDAIVAAAGVGTAAEVTDAHLSAITLLNLKNKSIASLKSGDFEGLTALTDLYLSNNAISDLSPLEGLTSLIWLELQRNAIRDISALENLTNLTDLNLDRNAIRDLSPLENLTDLIWLDLSNNAVSDISVLEDLTNLTVLYLHANAISDISALEDLTALTALHLSNNAITDVSVLEDLTKLRTLDLSGNPILDYGPLRRLKAANPNVTIDIDLSNNLPVFSDGDSTTRSVAENTVSGTNIGAPVAATDADNHTLTYTLSGEDVASFRIVSSSGQLQTEAALDFETKDTYTVTVSVYDGNSGGDTIAVTIGVTDVYEWPSTLTPLSERTPEVRDAIVAAAGVSTAAEVTHTHLAAITLLNLRNKSIASLKSGDFDGLTALTDLYLSNNAISDLSPLEGLTSLIWLELQRNAIRDLSALENLTNLTDLNLDRNAIRDLSPLEGLTDLIWLDLSNNAVSDLSALEDLTDLTVLYLHANAISDISALEDLTKLTALHLSNNAITDVATLENLTKLRTLDLSGNPILDYGPLRRLKAANPNVTIDIDLSNNLPVFSDGDSTTRSVAENTASGTNIGVPVAATDADNHTLTYTLSGEDVASFRIVSSSGQLQTEAALDFETKDTYTVTVSVYDGNSGGDTIAVTINVTDVYEWPSTLTPLSERTQQVRDAIVAAAGISTAAEVTHTHLAAITLLDLKNKNITALKSGDFEGLTGLKNLYLSDNSISDISVLKNVTSLRVLLLTGNPISDLSAVENLTSLIYLELYRTSISDISALEDLTNLIYLDIANNSISDISALENLTKLTDLYLSNNSISDISVLENLTDLAELHLYRNTVSDISALENLTDLVWLELSNNAIRDLSPLEDLTDLTVLYLHANAISDISALADLTDLTDLHLSNNAITDVSVLEDLTKLTTLYLKSNPILDYGPLRRLETTNPRLSIDVNLSNNLPVFSDGDSTTRSVAENTASGTNIGAPVAATDADNHTLTYSLSGDDADAFRIVSSSGQLQTDAALDYETKNAYTVTVTVYDGNSGGDTIAVTINVTDVYEWPSTLTPLSERTSQVREAIVAAAGVSTAAEVNDAHLSAITLLNLRDKSITSLKSGDFEGLTALTDLYLSNNAISDLSPLEGLTSLIWLELQRNAIRDLSALENLTNLTDLNLDRNAISDISALEGLTDLIWLDLSNNAVSDISVLEDLTDLTVLYLHANAISDISALEDLTDLTDLHLSNNAITDVSTLEDLTALRKLDLSGNPISDYGPLRRLQAANPNVTIDIDLSNNLPVFSDGDSTTLSVAENTASGTTIGTPVTATDADNDTLIYALGGPDADAFRIVSSSGQLQTDAALDYETKDTYTFTVIAYDGNSGGGTIAVTIGVTDVYELPSTITPVNQRTPQVRDAIVAATGVSTAAEVTETHLSAITLLNLRNKNITALKSGDFDGLTALTDLYLSNNAISDLSALENLTSLIWLELQRNAIRDISALENLTNLTDLNLDRNAIRDLSPLENLTSLIWLDLSNNAVSDLSVLENLTDLTVLYLHANAIGDISALEDLTALTALHLSNNAITDVATLENLTKLRTLDLSGNPILDYGPLRRLKAANPNVTIDIDLSNNLPVFSESDSTTRSISENAVSGTTIGAPVAATDADNDTLTYSLGGPDAESFRIVSTTGQLQTDAALDYETQSSYTVTVIAYDGNSGGDAIAVTITVTDVYEWPSTLTPLSQRTSQVRDAIVAAAGVSSADDVTAAHLSAITLLSLRTKGITSLKSGDFDGLTGLGVLYLSGNSLSDLSALENLTSLTWLDLSHNTISDLSALEGLTKLTDLHLLHNTISDISALEGLTDLIWLDLSRNTISDLSALDDLTDLTTLHLNNNTISDLSALEGLTDLVTLQLGSNTISDISALDDLTKLATLQLSNNSVSDISALEGLTDLATLHLGNNTISDISALEDLTKLEVLQLYWNVIRDISALEDLTKLTGLSLDYNSIGDISVLGDLTSLATLDLSGNPILDYGPLRRLQAANPNVTIDIDLSNNLPVFSDGDSATRSISENAVSGTTIGTPIAATDADNDTLTYSLSGPDAAAFRIVNTTGQLQTDAALDYETQSSYTVTVSVYDGNSGGDTIAVTIGVTDVYELPSTITPLSQRTQQVRDAIVAAASVNSADDVTAAHLSAITSLNLSDKNITALKSGDFDGLTALINLDLYHNSLSDLSALEALTKLTWLDLSHNAISDISALENLTSLTDLYLSNNAISDIATLEDLTKLIWLGLSNNSLSDLSALEALTKLTWLDLSNNAIGDISALENLTLLTDLNLHRNAISNISALEDLTALTRLDLSNNAVSDLSALEDLTALARLVLSNNAIRDLSALENLTKLTVLYLSNNAIRDLSPLKDLTALTDLHLSNNAISDVATLENLTDLIDLYLSGNPILDYGPLRRLQAANPNVTIDINLNNNPPVFSEGGSTTRAIPENTVSGTNIGDPLAATDADNDTLTYSLSGPDVASFRIVSTTGQLQTDAALDYETKNAYTVTVITYDGNSGGDAIAVTITVTDVEEWPSTLTPLSQRTPEVREAIVAAAGVSSADDVTATHLAGITSLSLPSSNIAALKAGDFEGLTALQMLLLNNNQLTVLPDTVFSGLTALQQLNLSNNQLTVLPGAVFSGLTALQQLNLNDNQLTVLPDTVFSGLTALQQLNLNNNTVDPLALTVSLEKVADGQFKAVAPAGAPFAIVLPLTITNGSIDEDLTGITIPIGGVESQVLTVSRTAGTTAAITVDIEALPELPTDAELSLPLHQGYALVKSEDLPLTVATRINTAPVFTDGDTTTRTVAENTASETDVGAAVSATDVDTEDTLTYTLSGDDADAFGIVSTSGQLQTKAALDYETKKAYTVTVSVSDGEGGTDSITVTINVTNINEAPTFTDGDTTTRSIAENTEAGENIGAAVSATDVDTGNTLTYTLSGDDADAFGIVSTSGQLQTKAALDYETKKAYTVTVSVSDGEGGTDSITVTINVTDINETPDNNVPIFTEGSRTTRSIAENTEAGENIGAAVVATDTDGDTLTYGLGGTDSASFRVVSTSGQLQTKAALDYETQDTYTVVVSVSDGAGGGDSIAVTINLTDVNEAPTFTDGDSTTRAVSENTPANTNIGTAVAATDVDGDTLTYSLSGDDAEAFSIVSTSGQLQTKDALDYETKASYSVTVSVSDGSLSDSITVTINVTNISDNAPVFADGDSTTRAIAENTAAGENIGTAVAATDVDNDVLTYSLSGGDADAFGIDSTSGQLQTNAALNYETKNTYLVTVTASDGSLSNSITVTINVTNVNEAPIFTVGDTTTRSVAENTAAGENIGTAIEATDVDADTTLTYSLNGDDADAFSIVATSGQLQTKDALDFETDDTYSVTVTATDGGDLSATINVTITVTDANDAPTFTEGERATREIAENTEAGENIGDAIEATDVDADTTLTYNLSGDDADAFSIVETSGQLQTKDALDFETDDTYSVTVTATDGGDLSATINVTITVTDVNDAPTFTEGATTTRSVAENTAASKNIGDAVVATDQDRIPDPNNAGQFIAKDTLTYTLGGDDAAAFGIDSASGQLQTNAALDYETQTQYSVTVSVSDGNGGTDSITVTINIIDVIDWPIDPPLSARTQQVREAIVAAIDGVDSAADVTSAHIAEITFLNLANKSITSLKSGDFNGFISLSRLRLYSNSISDISALENLTSLTELSLYSNSISNISALDDLTKLTELSLSHNSISDISALDDLTKLTDLDLTNNSSISDISALDDLTALTDLHLGSNSISDISALDDLTALTDLDLSNNSISDISALDDLTALTDLGLTNNSIRDISALDDLTALTDLNLSGNAISDISVLESLTKLTKLYLRINPISDYGPLRRLQAANPALTIDISLDNNPPVFADGDSTTRSINENTATGTNIGAAVAATDADNHTLTYSLGGPDAASFSIVETSGQLQTEAALDFETKNTYTVTVTVYDGNSGGDRITVTITVMDVAGAAPSVEMSPVIPDRTALLTNYPNPFNPETWIPYQLAKPADVRLTIYDGRGVVVRELRLGHQPAGVYLSRSRAIHWDGRNMLGEKVATGVYFYTLKAGDYTATRKLLIRK